MSVKGKGQRLIPEELLKYLEALKDNHSDPSAEWGSSGGGLLEDIEDAAGNKRFIEGTPEFKLTSTYPLTSVYTKWSLSGTHLMIVGVLSNETAETVTLPSNLAIYEATLPEWIMNKIYVIDPDSFLISKMNFVDSSGNRNIDFRLLKSDKLSVQGVTGGLLSGRQVRFQFDLLIDSE